VSVSDISFTRYQAQRTKYIRHYDHVLYKLNIYLPYLLTATPRQWDGHQTPLKSNSIVNLCFHCRVVFWGTKWRLLLVRCVKVFNNFKAQHLYSATSGNCSCSSAVRHRLGRTCSL